MSEKIRSVGALWKRTSMSGKVYLKGVIQLDSDKYGIVVFSNKFKNKDKDPDYKIFPTQKFQNT